MNLGKWIYTHFLNINSLIAIVIIVITIINIIIIVLIKALSLVCWSVLFNDAVNDLYSMGIRPRKY
jgi:hypothetical protein